MSDIEPRASTLRATSGGAGAYYRAELDVLRCLAFSLVFVFHSSASVGGPAVLAGGAFGVDLFFLLSAYLITELFRQELGRKGKIDVPAFYLRRILRIWPLYFGFIAVIFTGSFFIREIQMPIRAMTALTFFYANWYLITAPFFLRRGYYGQSPLRSSFTRSSLGLLDECRGEAHYR